MSKLEREIKLKLAQVEEQILGGWSTGLGIDPAVEHLNYRSLLARRQTLVELINFIEDERKTAASNPGATDDDD